MWTKPVELFPLDQLIEVGRHHLKDDASVAPEYEGGIHVELHIAALRIGKYLIVKTLH